MSNSFPDQQALFKPSLLCSRIAGGLHIFLSGRRYGVDVTGSGAFNLAKYLVWVAHRTPEVVTNSMLIDLWIEHFHK